MGYSVTSTVTNRTITLRSSSIDSTLAQNSTRNNAALVTPNRVGTNHSPVGPMSVSITAKNRELAEARNDVSLLSKSCEQYEEMLQKKNKTIAVLQQELSDARKKHHEVNTGLTLENARLSKLNTQYKNERDRCVNEIHKLKIEIQTLKARNEDLMKIITTSLQQKYQYQQSCPPGSARSTPNSRQYSFSPVPMAISPCSPLADRVASTGSQIPPSAEQDAGHKSACISRVASSEEPHKNATTVRSSSSSSKQQRSCPSAVEQEPRPEHSQQQSKGEEYSTKELMSGHHEEQPVAHSSSLVDSPPSPPPPPPQRSTRRKEVKSYKEPSLRSKLRKGMEHTFGEFTFSSGSSTSSSRRTKKSSRSASSKSRIQIYEDPEEFVKSSRRQPLQQSDDGDASVAYDEEVEEDEDAAEERTALKVRLFQPASSSSSKQKQQRQRRLSHEKDHKDEDKENIAATVSSSSLSSPGYASIHRRSQHHHSSRRRAPHDQLGS